MVAVGPPRVKGCCHAIPEVLPEGGAQSLAVRFSALADPTRVQMLHSLRLAEEPICVCDFTAAFDLGQPTISHHLAKLRDAGFISSFRRGIWTFYQLDPDMASEARALLDLIP